MDENQNPTPAADTNAGEQVAPVETETQAAPTPVDAPAEVPDEAPTGEVVLGASQDGGVVTEPTPVIQ